MSAFPWSPLACRSGRIPGRRWRRFRPLIAAAAVAAAVLSTLGAGFVTAAARADVRICDKYGSTTIGGGKYIVQNNNWGDDTAQCITATGSGFEISSAAHHKPANGPPGSYPAIYAGCHYGNCSTGSGMPMPVSSPAFRQVTTSVTMSYPDGGVYDAAYDVWFDPTARTNGQNTGAELMVWLNHTGAIQPVGSKVGRVTLAGSTWDLWFGNIGWNVASYVRAQPATSLGFAVAPFFDDLLSRGYAQRAWYLTSVQAGFEPWVGGTGLRVTSFSYSTTGATAAAPAVPAGTRTGPGTGTGTGTGTAGASVGCTATYRTAASWPGGFLALVTVQAAGATTGWRVSWTPPVGQSLAGLWGGRVSVTAGAMVVNGAVWNSALASGGSATFGFVAAGPPAAVPASCTTT